MKEKVIGRRKLLKGLAAGSGLLLAGPAILPKRSYGQRKFKATLLAFGHSQRLLGDLISEETGPKYGIELDVKTTFDPRTTYTMMMAKGAEFYFTGWLTLADMRAQGQVKAKSISSSFLWDAKTYVPLQSPLRTAADLKGKRLGAYGSAAGTSTQLLAFIMKDLYAIDIFKDLKVLFGAPEVIHRSMVRGELDAVLNTPVVTPEMLDRSRFRVIMDPQEELQKKTGVGLLITTVITYDELLERNPEGVRNFLKARNEAVEMFKKDSSVVETRLRKLADIRDPNLLRVNTQNIVENFTTVWNERVIEVHKQIGRMVVEIFGKDKVAGVPDEAFTTAFNP